jgi:two-component system alkaline phosphatase synthesis response regulator PhoP
MNENVKVLVVDDEPDIVEILSYNLCKEKYAVCTAYNGEDGLQLAKAQRPDLIIMDVRMPGISGIEACRKLKADELLKHIPVLFLTADADEYTSMNAQDAGGEHFITKPIRPNILIGLVNDILRQLPNKL